MRYCKDALALFLEYRDLHGFEEAPAQAASLREIAESLQAEKERGRQQDRSDHPPLEVTRVTLSLIPQALESSNLRAFATVVLNHCFQVNSLQVRQGDHGPTVAMPARLLEDGRRNDICFPITSQAYLAIRQAVLTEYQRAVERSAEREGVSPPPAEAAGTRTPQPLPRAESRWEGPER